MADVRHHALAAVMVAGIGLAAPAHAQVAHDAVRFLTVDQGQDEFRADETLASSLSGLVEAPQAVSYKQIIKDVVGDESQGGTIARLTPYAFVVAEMMGARLDLLATYSSRSTMSTIYNAYFVVRRDFVAGSAQVEPSLDNVTATLRERSRAGRPATFVYHDQLSTSSYFLPSLRFRLERVFAQDGAPNADVTTVTVARLEPRGTSGDLVRAVARGAADIAAVWDGTRAGFNDPARPELAETGSQVWFVKIPEQLPCDLLVATSKVDDPLKAAVRERLAAQVPATEGDSARDTERIGVTSQSAMGDVAFWVPWTDRAAEDAREALSFLRRKAMAPATPVVVNVKTTNRARVSGEELEAVRQGIRLAGTELVPKREYFDYYKQHDVEWVLSRIHDGAIRLNVVYDHFKLGDKGVEQQFDISFVRPDDLTRRVGTLIHSRMHRIRQIWLYNDQDPTIIRDVDFDVAAGTRLPLQKIEWSDPEVNVFRVQDTKDIVVVGSDSRSDTNTDFHTFRFDAAPFARRSDNTIDFEPMGRTAYRVLLMRTEEERPLFRALTVALVALFALAAVGLVWDLRRVSRRHSRGAPLVEARHAAAEEPPDRAGDEA